MDPSAELKALVAEADRTAALAAKHVAVADRAALAAVRLAMAQADGYVLRAATALGWHRRRLQRFLASHPTVAPQATRERGRPKATGTEG